MGVESESDRAVFLNTDDFGVEALYKEDGAGDGVTINVLFEKEDLSIDPEEGDLQNDPPTARARTSDGPNAAHKDTLAINSVTYEVKTPRPDGEGMTLLRMKET